MAQLRIFIACWAVTYAGLWSLLGEAAIIPATFYATALYVPTAFLFFLYRRRILHALGRFGVFWGASWLAMAWANPDAPQDPYFFSATSLLALTLGFGFTLISGSRGIQKRGRSILDSTLLKWTAADSFSMRNLLDGGLVFLGRPGSGKTSSSGRLLAMAIVAFGMSGGLILSSSPSDLGMWRAIFAACGRAADLIVVGPGHPHRFDFIPFLFELGLEAKDITKSILTIGESRDNDETKGADKGDVFWSMQMREKLETTIHVLTLAGEVISTTNIHRFIVSAAQSPTQLKDDEWKAGSYHNQCFSKAYAASKTPAQASDFQLAWDVWLTQWPAMNERTRTSVEAQITGTLYVFNSGSCRTLLTGPSTVTPKVMSQRKFIFVDMSVGQHGTSGAFVLNAYRLATQRYVLRRNPDSWEVPIVIWADEAGKLCNSADSSYLTESRKFGGATVFLAQSLNSFLSAFPGDQGKARAELLLGCFSTVVAHAIGDPSTAEWLSKLVGTELKSRYGYGGSGDRDPTGAGTGVPNMSFNISQTVEACMQPGEFMHGLRTGGKHNKCLCDAIIVRTGEPFSDGSSAIFRTFSQV